MTFTINDQILQFNFIFEIYFDSQHTPATVGHNIHVSPATVVFEK